MQIFIIDTTGSVSSEQIEAGTRFAQKLIGKIDVATEITCLVHCGNFDSKTPRRFLLENLTNNFRSMDPECVITYITDGFLTESQTAAVDNIYLFQDTGINNYKPDYLTDKICGMVSVPFGG
jgi:hypothetical protein